MESRLQIEPTAPATEATDNVHPGVTLLTALYDEKDLLLFRPVEPINSLVSVRASQMTVGMILRGRFESFDAYGPTSTTAMLR